MHIPDSMMHGRVCPVTAAVAVTALAASGYAAAKSKDKPAPAKFAAVSVFVFAVQMLNFPVQHGTSGHFLGGTLAAALLGVPHGIIAMAIALAGQTLIFGDGGVTALGANVINMALIGAGLGGLLRHYFTKAGMRDSAATGFAAWASVVAAAAACSFEIASRGQLGNTLRAMLPVHALTGVAEAAVTVAAVKLFATRRQSSADYAPALAAAACAVVAAPFSSKLPGLLEQTASAAVFSAPLAGYALPAVANPHFSVAAAGALGAAVVFCAAYLAAKTLSPQKA
ncbi:MAG: energy-coupling factor ABC transporter permease [Elusimicrobiales bacterium]